MLAPAVALALVTALAGGSAGVASAAVQPHHDLLSGAHRSPGAGLTLAQAPAGLQAAVRGTLGGRARAFTAAFEQAKLSVHGDSGGVFGYSVAVSGATAVVGAPLGRSFKGVAYVFTHSATGWSQQAKLIAAGPAGTEFGASVAVSGSTAVVGATDANSGTGAAYVFTGSGPSWSQQAKLTASDAAAGDEFGSSVAISGTDTVVGALGKNSLAGAAYVFAGSGRAWSQRAELTASDGAADDQFGYSVAISGTTAVVGAPGQDSNTGAAYMFARSHSAWPLQAEFRDPGGITGDDFGVSVAVSGRTAVVGATAGQNSGPGAVHVFARVGTAWYQDAELTAADGVSGDTLGDSVAISGSTVLAGADGRNSGTGAAYVFALPSLRTELTPVSVGGAEVGNAVAMSGSTAVVGAQDEDSGLGAAYVYVRSAAGWVLQAQLIGFDGDTGDDFGASVTISGSTIVVGAPGRNSGAGAVYVFTRSGAAWSLQAEEVASDQIPGAGFGASVGISGSTMVIGSPQRNTDTGTAYIYIRSGTSWSPQAELTADDGATNDFYGKSVAISGSTVVVGAYGHNSHTGTAYVYHRLYSILGTNWMLQAELTAADGIANDEFGYSVAISGPTVVVGAQAKDSFTGWAYVFTRSGATWSQQAELTAADPSSDAAFGQSVAISGSTVVVGAPDRHSFDGAMYVFARSHASWSQQAELVVNDPSSPIFGYSAAVSGTNAVIGGPGANSGTGAAYVYANV